MIEIKVDKKNKEIQIDLGKHIKYVPKLIEQALKDIGNDVVEETRSLIKSGDKTGRKYSIKGKKHTASAPGEAPANITGKLAKSANYAVRNAQEMSIGESESYAVYLETGTKKKIAPRPHLIAAINKKAGDTYNTLEKALEKL